MNDNTVGAPDRKSRLDALIRTSISPLIKIEIEDESGGHSRGLETHYRILLVSLFFENMNRVSRQRFVMALFSDEFKNGLHSVSLRLLTPSEWGDMDTEFATPGCAGGRSNP